MLSIDIKGKKDSYTAVNSESYISVRETLKNKIWWVVFTSYLIHHSCFDVVYWSAADCAAESSNKRSSHMYDKSLLKYTIIHQQVLCVVIGSHLYKSKRYENSLFIVGYKFLLSLWSKWHWTAVRTEHMPYVHYKSFQSLVFIYTNININILLSHIKKTWNMSQKRFAKSYNVVYSRPIIFNIHTCTCIYYY